MDSHMRSLIAAARAGQGEAYRGLLAAYAPRLYGYFYRATGSHHDAEDLLGDLMLRLVRRMGDYDDRGRFEPWLFSIAANLVRDRIRRSRSRPGMSSLESDDEEGGSLGDALPGSDRPIETHMLQQELGQELSAALAMLEETSRQMVLLRHFAQLSFKEIAEIFKCPLGTVLARVHRAIKVLRTVMEKSHERDA